MTWHIAICEVDKTQQKNLIHMLKKWEESSSHMLQIHTYNDCESFLFEWEEQMKFDILLLDIDLGQGKMTGIELARRIRKKDSKLTIIFITGLLEYISEGYDVQALHYLIKPIEEKKLFELLDRAATQVKSKEEYLLLENEAGVQLIPYSQLVYVEAFSHTIALYQKKNNQLICEYFRMSMTELEQKLPVAEFYRCHRSYLVHLNHIQKLKKGELVLDCGTKVPVSRSKEKHLYETFLNYHRKLLIETL